MRSLQTVMIVVLVIIAIVLFALGGYMLGMGGFNSDDSSDDQTYELERDIARLKASQAGLNEQLILLQAENERLRTSNTVQTTYDYPPLTFIRDTYDKCDNIEEDIEDVRDDIDDLEDEIDEIEDDIAAETDPIKKAELQADWNDMNDELDDLNDELDDLYDDEDDERC